MRALQYRAIGAAPEVVHLPDPEPGPGQVLLRVTAAGACHSDVSLMSLPAEHFRFPLPFGLGHEGVGTVAALGAGVTGVGVGDAVAVYGPRGCGRCVACAQGRENYCPHAAQSGQLAPGLGAPGTIAEYLLVDGAHRLIALDGLDPVKAAPLTDAGLTPYHAVKRALPRLLPGSTAVVIGAGGLGHLAVQLLRALTAATVVVLDVTEEKLALARTVGAHMTVLSDADAPATVHKLTDGLGAEVVFDFVGVPATTAAAAAMVAMDGEISLVGIGGGSVPVGFGALPYAVSVSAPFWGSRSELAEVLALARTGAVDVHVQTFYLDDAPRAYELLHAGRINGRAVILPHG